MSRLIKIKNDTTQSLSSQNTNNSDIGVNDQIRRVIRGEEQKRLRRNGRSELEFVNSISQRLDPKSNAILPNGSLYLHIEPTESKPRRVPRNTRKIRSNPFKGSRRKNSSKHKRSRSRSQSRSQSRSRVSISPSKQNTRKLTNSRNVKSKRKILGNVTNLQ